MPPLPVEAAAFTWSRIQRLHDAAPALHWQRRSAEGLECPQEVFTQVFIEEENNPDFAAIVRTEDRALFGLPPTSS